MSQCAIYDASKEVRRILANISKRSFLFRECRGKKGVKTIEKRGKNLLNAVKFPNQIFLWCVLNVHQNNLAVSLYF